MCQKVCTYCGKIFPSYGVEGSICPNCGQESIRNKYASGNVASGNVASDRTKVDKHTRKRLRK